MFVKLFLSLLLLLPYSSLVHAWKPPHSLYNHNYKELDEYEEYEEYNKHDKHVSFLDDQLGPNSLRVRTIYEQKRNQKGRLFLHSIDIDQYCQYLTDFKYIFSKFDDMVEEESTKKLAAAAADDDDDDDDDDTSTSSLFDIFYEFRRLSKAFSAHYDLLEINTIYGRTTNVSVSNLAREYCMYLDLLRQKDDLHMHFFCHALHLYFGYFSWNETIGPIVAKRFNCGRLYLFHQDIVTSSFFKVQIDHFIQCKWSEQDERTCLSEIDAVYYYSNRMLEHLLVK